MRRRLIVVSNRLPVSVHEQQGNFILTRSNGGLATALASLFDKEHSVWVGWTGLRKRLTNAQLEALNFPKYLAPINLTRAEIAGYYDGFSNGVLWPLAHGLQPQGYSNARWQIYKSVAAHFADAIKSIAQPQDVIWVHDYHLLILPQLLRERGLKNRIGFFMHTPFFAPQALSQLPHTPEIISALVNANLLGFQTQNDVNKFKQTRKILLGDKPLKLDPVIKNFPIGIDFNQFDSLNNDKSVTAAARKYRATRKNQTIIFSLSRLDYTKGILTQLDAFEKIIMPGKVVYRLNVAPSREQVPEYKRLKRAIEKRVASINQRHGTADWQPIDYSYNNFGLKQIAALYQSADIHLNTPLADGMNLVAKEYIAARRKPGVLVISSAMGAAAQLKDAIIVPPQDVCKIAAALKQAIAMPETEKSRRWQQLRSATRRAQATDWANSFLDELISAYSPADN